MTFPLPTTRRGARPSNGGRVGHSARAVMARAIAACLATLLLVATLTGGRSYVWCSMTERAGDACCCAPAADAGGTPSGDAELRVGCCEHEALGTLAPARVGGDALDPLATMPAAMPAPPPAILVPPAPVDSWDRVAAPPLLRATPIRAGPRTASDTCVRLQVFRC